MKFIVTPSAAGTYCTKNGKTVALLPAEHGAEHADESAAATAFGLTVRPLFFARQKALADLVLDAETPVTVQGLSMGSGSDSQLQLNNLVTLLGLARDAQSDQTGRDAFMGLMVSTLTGPVTDHLGGEHDMSVADAFGFVILYGQAVGQARRASLLKRAVILAAQSVEELP